MLYCIIPYCIVSHVQGDRAFVLGVGHSAEEDVLEVKDTSVGGPGGVASETETAHETSNAAVTRAAVGRASVLFFPIRVRFFFFLIKKCPTRV